MTITFLDTVTTQVFETTSISYVNEPSGSTVTVLSNALEVTLRGPAEELASVTSSNIRVVGDLTISAPAAATIPFPPRCMWTGQKTWGPSAPTRSPSRSAADGGRYDTDCNSRAASGKRSGPNRRRPADRLRTRLRELRRMRRPGGNHPGCGGGPLGCLGGDRVEVSSENRQIIAIAALVYLPALRRFFSWDTRWAPWTRSGVLHALITLLTTAAGWSPGSPHRPPLPAPGGRPIHDPKEAVAYVRIM